MAELTAAVVIATYRRPQVLTEALDAWEASTLRPDQVVVVDASPDARGSREAVLSRFGRLFAAPGSAYLCTSRAALTSQRNLGLDCVQCDIVLFVDDDTRVDPDYLEKVMEVFEADPDGVVGAVGGTNRRAAKPAARIRRRVFDVGRRFAGRLDAPSGRAWTADVVLPAGVAALPVERRRNLHGACMSFRTEVAQRERCDEHLERGGYGEDFDLSYRVSRTHALVRRRDAWVRHEPAPDGRPDAAQHFLVSWVNPAYLVEKLFPVPSSRRHLRRLFVLSRWGSRVKVRLGRRVSVDLQWYEVAEGLMDSLRDAPVADLAHRFLAAQQWIFVPENRPTPAATGARQRSES